LTMLTFQFKFRKRDDIFEKVEQLKIQKALKDKQENSHNETK